VPSELDAASLEWAMSALPSRAVLHAATGLRAGSPPWLIEARLPDGRAASAVLRVGAEPDDLAVELDSQRFAATHGIPAAAVLAVRFEPPTLLLIEALNGSSAVPQALPAERLHQSGQLAGRISRCRPPDTFPVRNRPIAGVNFEELRRADPYPAFIRAEAALARARTTEKPISFVHGDLWQGNLLWEADTLSGVLDWDCAGRGASSLDLASLRLDAAMCWDTDAAGYVLEGWRTAAGRDPTDLAYWDVVAALATPSDLGWFVEATHEQGRTDLTREIMVARRDAFLESAIDRLERGDETTRPW
jgi:aminoglycoside phosphotransferase